MAGYHARHECPVIAVVLLLIPVAVSIPLSVCRICCFFPFAWRRQAAKLTTRGQSQTSLSVAVVCTRTADILCWNFCARSAEVASSSCHVVRSYRLSAYTSAETRTRSLKPCSAALRQVTLSDSLEPPTLLNLATNHISRMETSTSNIPTRGRRRFQYDLRNASQAVEQGVEVQGLRILSTPPFGLLRLNPV